MSLTSIITPFTHPDRFQPDEAALFRAGRCSWQVNYGTGFGRDYCEQRSKQGASFGNCADHDAEFLEDCWPDGSRR